MEKKQPAVKLAAFGCSLRGNQIFIGELFGEKGEDGGGFSNHRVAVFQGGGFAHRVHSQIVGRFHFCAILHGYGLIIRAAFFQHPANHAAA